jgi:methylglutaconyl-CoA hydratase
MPDRRTLARRGLDQVNTRLLRRSPAAGLRVDRAARAVLKGGGRNLEEDVAMTQRVIRTEIDARGVATVALDRPAVHNAYDEQMIAELGDGLSALASDPQVRLLVLRGSGRHFQAGADLNCLKRLANAPAAANLDFSGRTTEAMHALCTFPRPTLALVQGACYGGGVGMVACCDIALASEQATFALTEVRWGVIPAPIIPQLCAAMGVRGVRRYGLTGERFDAREALRIELIHEICAEGELDRAAAPISDALLQSAPEAVAESKQLVLAHAGLELSPQQLRALAVQAAVKRASPEAAEGLQSFLARRRPSWSPPTET